MYDNMVKRYFKSSIIWIWFCLPSFAQTGGQHIYQFVNLSPSARMTALGGMPMAWRSSDAGTVFHNPSLLTNTLSGNIAFSHQFYFEDIGAGHLSYSHTLSKPNINIQGGVHYINYGDIPQTDVYGNINSQFTARETDFYFAASKTIQDRLVIGGNLQYIFSSLDIYHSQGLNFNTGVSYFNPEKQFGLSLLVKNAGFQMSKYNNERENLPFEIQLGFAKKLAHLPLIYHITFQHLESWDLSYDDPAFANDGLLFGEAHKENAFEDFLGNLIRHFVIGAELNFGKNENFSLRLGYNHLRKKDLSVADYRSVSGLSGGFGIKIYKFKIDYSYAVYHLAGGTSQLSFSTNLNSFVKTEM
jgi:hypothetical protein